MRSLSSSAKRTNGSSASLTSTGSISSTLSGKLGLEHLGSLAPILFTNPRVVLINCVRTVTNASRARSTTRSCRTSVLRCWIGNNDCGSIRPSRASLWASIWSFLRLRRFAPSISRGLATSTSCPQPTTTSHPGRVRPHLDDRAHGRQSAEEFRHMFPRRLQLPLCQRLPLQPQNAVVAPLVSQIHSHRQPVPIGGRRALWLFLRCLLRRRFWPEPFAQLRYQLCHHSLESRCTGPRAFAGF